ncbi:MAG TPA: histidine--tRNA ligase [Geminicoccaceae bacterium]
MPDLRPPRGTHDLLGEDLRRHRHVAETGRELARRYGYGEIVTPTFEHLEVFARTLGDTSDVVTKEMYVFKDRGGEDMCLRPENTASVVRAVISGGMAQDLPLKFFYYGPMFRYERPQKGRLRQFHQIGVELMGASEPMADVEVMALGQHILDELGVAGSVTLQINSLGDPASRQAYREALVAYLEGHRDRLSHESQTRLERNPLRILDSKDEGDRAVLADAPPLDEHLNEASRTFFARVREGLERLGVNYETNPRLVRGLDYYTHTAFEFVTTALGAQGAVIAGGRYDGLVRAMGGPDVPGVGWAAGVERLAMLLPETPAALGPAAIIPIGDAAEPHAWELAQKLRRAGLAVEISYKGKPGQRMKRASKLGASHAISLGDAELAQGVVKLRDLDSGAEEEVPMEGIADRLRPE